MEEMNLSRVLYTYMEMSQQKPLYNYYIPIKRFEKVSI
jgi:hypothetical protein